MGSVVTVDLTTMTVLEVHDDDEICHLYDKDPNLALCGANITNAKEVYEDDEAYCLVCLEIDDLEMIWEA